MRISDWSSDVCSSDLRGRDREPLDPDAEQRHRFQGSSAHFAADAESDFRPGYGADDTRKITHDDRREPVVTPGQPWVRAVGGEEALGEVVGADRQEVEVDRKSTRLNSSH